jgi:hypothetical protein
MPAFRALRLVQPSIETPKRKRINRFDGDLSRLGGTWPESNRNAKRLASISPGRETPAAR